MCRERAKERYGRKVHESMEIYKFDRVVLYGLALCWQPGLPLCSHEFAFVRTYSCVTVSQNIEYSKYT